MPESLNLITNRSISPEAVLIEGNLTYPRSYGVYELSRTKKSTRCFRFGNHPIRMIEFEREFKNCALRYLFLNRSDAEELALHLNKL